MEIGVYKGEFSEKLAAFGGELYSVDPWLIYQEYGNSRGQKRLDEQCRQATERLSKYPNVTVVRKTSMEALADFEDESLDFVYIDGNHLFPYVAQDMYFWASKIRTGGILCGHDYARFKSHTLLGACHAKQIVDAYVQSFDVPNFWVLGEYKYKEGDKRDRWRSWMILKDYVTPKHRVDN